MRRHHRKHHCGSRCRIAHWEKGEKIHSQKVVKIAPRKYVHIEVVSYKHPKRRY